jgi:hypothetical protein
MPHLTFALDPDGMIVQAVFGLNGFKTAALVQAGQPVPRPIPVRALIDSGADTTTIAPGVFKRLGLVPSFTAFSQRASGSVKVNLYNVSMTITGLIGAVGPTLVLPDLLVSELTAPLPVDALIGLDVLRQCLVVLDGPGQQFILGF